MKSDFFGGLAPRVDNGSVYVLRRKELIEAIKAQFPAITTGVVVLFAAFEQGSERFRQDKTFYYYTGVNEPGTALVIDLKGKSTLYIPNCFEKRAQWMTLPEALIKRDAKALNVDAVELLGDECEGYELNPYFSPHEYAHMITLLNDVINVGGALFTTAPNNGHEYVNTRFILDHLQKFIPTVQQKMYDISAFVAQSRRRKDVGEIEHVYRAVEITELAHESAVQAIKNGALEAEVQASLEYMMIASHARPSFPSIVASGKNGTVLHYNQNSGTLKDGDLVVVDIGAEFNNYCADLTRTYPVSGSFTKRQKELYSIVLAAQTHIADLAKPGMWLKNPNKPDQSLHHLAAKFISSRGYGKYFPHGIGHFLGLDVHDIGDYSVPLQEGDVITIEPGIYIPEEGIGIRIEDDYWVTKDGVICLSENLPKEIADIEAVVQQALSGVSDDEDEDDEYYDDEDEDEDDDMHH
jgi:Xaa-Pro aminopeptidase